MCGAFNGAMGHGIGGIAGRMSYGVDWLHVRGLALECLLRSDSPCPSPSYSRALARSGVLPALDDL